MGSGFGLGCGQRGLRLGSTLGLAAGESIGVGGWVRVGLGVGVGQEWGQG